MKIKATVFGKKGCGLCDNRKQNLDKFPAFFKKSTGKDLEIEQVYHDIGTVDGLVTFCGEDRTNSDIPVVVLENNKGEAIRVYHGPTDVISSRNLLEALGEQSLVG